MHRKIIDRLNGGMKEVNPSEINKEVNPSEINKH